MFCMLLMVLFGWGRCNSGCFIINVIILLYVSMNLETNIQRLVCRVRGRGQSQGGRARSIWCRTPGWRETLLPDSVCEDQWSQGPPSYRVVPPSYRACSAVVCQPPPPLFLLPLACRQEAQLCSLTMLKSCTDQPNQLHSEWTADAANAVQTCCTVAAFCRVTCRF